MRLFIKGFVICCLFLLLKVSVSLAQAPDEEKAFAPILSGWMGYTDASNSLYNHLAKQAIDMLAERHNSVNAIETQAEWQKRQDEIKATLMRIVGPFPERTPLKPRIVGTIQRPDYHVEKIMIEPQPTHYMTACMFIPNERVGKLPAVIYCSGHAALAFRSETYQHVIINLVKKGFIVFAFDPIGQGERFQYVDPKTNESWVGSPTKEHSYPGAQCFLIGKSVARYMIWDGIRSVDYLLSRDEVDPNRIGITGRSGGGTQSSYIAAFDERIHAAAPECYITNFTRLYQTRGPQDAEQNFFHGIVSGIDHPDLLIARAPKPALMITTTRDFFSIQGARETAADVRRCYAAFGAANNFSMVEDDAEHASTKLNREAMYAFFQKHLKNPGDATDDSVAIFDAHELWVTETGQISTSLGGRTVFDLNREEANAVIKQRASDITSEGIREKAAKWSGYKKVDSASDVIFAGRYQFDSLTVERYVLPGEGGQSEYSIPFLLLKPLIKKSCPAVIYLHPEGKEVAARQPEIQQLLDNGNIVALPDLLGMGELGPGDFRGDAYDFKMGKASFNIWFAAIQVGRSLVGIHAGDINRLALYLQSRDDVIRDNISGFANGTTGAALLHAALLGESFASVTLKDSYTSYESLVMNEFYLPQFMLSAVPGALLEYDVPDICAALAPLPIRVIQPVDSKGVSLSANEAKQAFKHVVKKYKSINAADQFQIVTER